MNNAAMMNQHGWSISLSKAATLKLAGFMAGMGRCEASGVGLVKASSDPLKGASVISFMIDDVFLLAGGSRSATEFDTQDMAPLIADLIKQGRPERIQDLRVWWHIHNFGMPSFSATDDHTATDRWGNEPWRIALLCYAGDKPGYTARYVQWNPPHIVDWDASTRPAIGVKLTRCATYLAAKAEAAQQMRVNPHVETEQWASLVSMEPKQLPLFHMAKKRWRPAMSDLMNLPRFAFGSGCHQQTGLGCTIYACPLNVYSEYGTGQYETRCAYGLDTVRLKMAAHVWQESLANWECFLSDQDSYYARLDDDTPWMPDINGTTAS